MFQKIPSITPGMGRPLPVPAIRTIMTRQSVDFRPAGNTIAVTALADNPFEGVKTTTVVTQASGGMAQAPRSMQSSSFASKQFMPGMGWDISSAISSGTSLVQGAAGGKSALDLATEAAAELAKQTALPPAQQNPTVIAETQKVIAAVEQQKSEGIDPSTQPAATVIPAPVEKKPFYTNPLVIGAAAAIGIAVFMFAKSKKK